MRKTTVRRRVAVIATAVIATAAAAAIVIPSLAASAPGSVRLHLGSDGQYFAYGATQQPLTTNGCRINSPAGPIINLSAGNKSPGLVDKGIGVKGSNATGTPCGQVDGTEALKLARGGSLGTRQFTGVRLDLEMTGDAIVRLTLSSSTTSADFRLQTGRSITTAQSSELGYDSTVPYAAVYDPAIDTDKVDACAAPNSSGPNSNINDNCQWTVMPGFPFDTITLATSGGSVALEGGGDFGGTDNDSMLYLANTAPTATDNAYTTDEDVSVQGNVLTDAPADSDAEGNPLTAAVVTGDGKGPEHGSVTVATNGDFTYTPDANWFGTDFFTYAASDGAATSEATVTVTVASVNDRPVAAVQDDPTSTQEDTSVTVTVATDVDNNFLTSSCTFDDGDPFTDPDGTFVDNKDGTVDFLPPLDFNGSINLKCDASDGLLSTTSSATIVVGVAPVNDAPIAVDDTDDVNADDSVDIDVLANDTDVDLGDSLSVTGIDNVTPPGATATLNPDLTVKYTPPPDYTGAGSFTYRVSDGSLTSNEAATVSITVYPVICTNIPVSDTDSDVKGTFTLLSENLCKRYNLDAINADDTVLFQPEGSSTVAYRGVLEFGPDSAPAAGGSGEYSLLLRYDPDPNTPEGIKPVQWCIAPQFDANGGVTSATLPIGETWCVASGYTKGGGTVSNPEVITVWQVYGRDDPKFLR